MSEARRSASGRIAAALLVILGLATILYQVVVDQFPKGDVRRVEGYTPWSKETLDAAATIPIQDGGRIKPLSTYAGFSMLSLHGARKMEISGNDGKSVILKPTAWLLDALFRPKFAIHQPTFRVDNSAALEAIGVKPREKRDRYSYNDIRPGREKLDVLSRSYQQTDAKKRDPIQNQIVDLAANVHTYEALLGHFTFARNGVPLPGSGADGQPDKRADLSAVLTTLPEIRKRVGQTQPDAPLPPSIAPLMEEISMLSQYARSGLAILPPHRKSESKWRNAGSAVQEIVSGTCPDPDTTIADLQLLETMARTADDEPAFRAAVVKLHDSLAARATARGDYRHVEREASYYRSNGFLHALAWYLLATLTALAMWITGRTRAGTILSWSTAVLTLVGLGFSCHAIIQRCIIMERPPVGNLYDTIVFISATSVLISLLTEWLVRRRFALGIAPIVGAALVLLARRFEMGDAKDHMDPLVAVLDSNFWLTTHVITIVLGYSAGLLASFLSTGYILLRGLRLDTADSPLRRSLTRSVYGMICFTLLLSLVGTVLGGIWANDSWGRFWGWDPKENGALLIVLWTLAILHARLGGFLKEWGLHLASVFTAIIVTFSWWHVNFLGVGLHNYGFTSGKDTIKAFYGAIFCVLLFGCITAALEAAAKRQTRRDPSKG